MSTTPPTSRRDRSEGTCILVGTSTQSSASLVIAARIARVLKRSSVRRGARVFATALAIDAEATATYTAAVERFASLDQRMTTTDVLRVVGVNRSTIFRWVKKGTLPQRHASGGWLRSDVERW